MNDRLFVLIDFDNLGGFRGSKSMDALLRHIESRIPANFVAGLARIEMRLYGGWVTGQTLTRQAQQISAEVQASFPATIQRVDACGKSIRLILSVAFARSGLFLPSEDLRDTFMPNRTIGAIKMDQSGWRSCALPSSCPNAIIESFLQSGNCHVNGCSVTPRDLLRKNEQKQVDTLLVADMADLALRQGVKRLVVVSSDADMWPGVLLALSAGASVCQMHTSSGGSTKATLRANLSRLAAAYVETSV